REDNESLAAADAGADGVERRAVGRAVVEEGGVRRQAEGLVLQAEERLVGEERTHIVGYRIGRITPARTRNRRARATVDTSGRPDRRSSRRSARTQSRDR